MKQLSVLAALVLAVSACGGGSDGAPWTATSADPRAELESRLERTAVGICDGECHTYHATVATCSGEGTEIAGRTYFRCRVEYETSGGYTPPADELCAALGDRGGHVARPLGDC